LTHPTKNSTENTLRHELIKLYPSIKEWGEPYREGIVHRLDKVTSGIIICALNELTYNVLSEQFKKRIIKKKYVSIIQGHTNTETATIDLPLNRSLKNRSKRTVDKSGRRSLTEYKTLLKTKNYTKVSINLITGRNHQIRAHMEYLKMPVVNDTLYGAKPIDFLEPYEICLHSSALEFSFFDEDYSFKVDPPLFFNRVLEV
jgi:Pseudouridylate synthases, 23S RNA-specific